jgi:hypothetical protein
LQFSTLKLIKLILTKLTNWLDIVGKIILDVQLCKANSERLHTYIYPHDKDYIQKLSFFDLYAYQLRFVLIIQLSKLFLNSRNEKWNFHYLCNFLNEIHLENDIVQKLEKNKSERGKTYQSVDELAYGIEKIKTILSNEQPIISKVQIQRNKFYAHRDEDTEFESLTLRELYRLSDIASSIHNELTAGIFNSTTFFDSGNTWKIDPILRQLSEYFDLKYPK